MVMNQKLAIGIVIMGLVAIMAFSGCTSLPALTCEDQSRQQLDRCNVDCGEGIGSTICKTGCTSEHQNRLEACTENR